jgi:hypothetical protein
MATTTPNFGWAVPTSTDLVKDGAVAIETLGDSIDASLVDLKGGTTGQVLAKASNTDMDFAWTTAGGSGSTNVAGKNGVLNSNLSIWQRGTSFTGNTSGYCADRWKMFHAGTGSTYSRQTTSDTTNLPFIQYALRLQRNVSSTDTNIIYTFQDFESVNSTQYAGKTVSFSFYARRGANFSATSNLITVNVFSGTGIDQTLSTAYSGQTSVILAAATLTTTWQRFTYSGTVASNATQVGVRFDFAPTGTAGAADFFEVTGVQLEIASAASAYSPNAATFQGELAACQRYYQRIGGNSAYEGIVVGIGASSTLARFLVPLKVTMRVAPTSVETNAIAVWDTATVVAATGATLSTAENGPNFLSVFTSHASGITQFRPYFLLMNNSTSAYLGINAEL